MKIVQLSIPTPFYVGDVNVYLIREDPVTLIDVGPKTAEAAAALRSKLAEHGVRIADIRRVVLTHAHEDHCGLARQIRDEAKDAEIFVHPWETGHLFGRLESEAHRSLMMRAGVPESVFRELQSLYSQVNLLTDALDDDEYRPLDDGMELEFESGSLGVVHTPGHTPGSCSFARKADRTLICGDCVLKRITPNPMLAPDPQRPDKRFPSLAEFLASLARLRAFSPTLAYGGHGEPVTDFDEIFNRYVRAVDERQKNVIGLLPKEGATAFDTARRLFSRSFDQDVHRFLAISEAVAHLDYAESNGRAAVEVSQGVEYYRAV